MNTFAMALGYALMGVSALAVLFLAYWCVIEAALKMTRLQKEKQGASL